MAEVQIYEDQGGEDEQYSEEAEGSGEEDVDTETEEELSSDGERMDENARKEMEKFQDSFRGISKRYRLVGRIGEGTFSVVYKAEDLFYDRYQNDWDIDEKQRAKWSPRSKRQPQQRRKPRYVAIKKIYVTSSPMRVYNELELLHDLRDSDSVCPLITAFRHQDQVIAILPYFQHADFRDYFREMKVSDMRLYLRSLLTALEAVHSHGILHRDIKPTNFLYSPKQARGVLVDFGLAEREGVCSQLCLCELPKAEHDRRIANCVNRSTITKQTLTSCYPTTDTRHSKRANRAGTRGFRAPEVLFKCTAQTTAIDIWSVGVILLTLISRRFPFFHSTDDIDAVLELCAILGKRRMRDAALQHGQVFECNIPSYTENGHGFEKIILWCTNRHGRDAQGRKKGALRPDEKDALSFLERMLECDPWKRITAKDALRHSFIVDAGVLEEDEDMIDLVGES